MLDVSREKELELRFLVVDAKRDSILFYERLGFELLNIGSNLTDENPLMFFDIYNNRPN